VVTTQVRVGPARYASFYGCQQLRTLYEYPHSRKFPTHINRVGPLGYYGSRTDPVFRGTAVVDAGSTRSAHLV